MLSDCNLEPTVLVFQHELSMALNGFVHCDINLSTSEKATSMNETVSNAWGYPQIRYDWLRTVRALCVVKTLVI